MDNKFNFNNEYYKFQEKNTNEKVDTIENLFKEQDEADKTFSQISLEQNTINSYNKAEDPLEQTKEISEIDLENLKRLSKELHAIYDEQPEENTQEENTQEKNTNTKGKTLVKATKQGIAFSNQNLVKTFLDCAVLCFITASIGGSWFLYILNHLN